MKNSEPSPENGSIPETMTAAQKRNARKFKLEMQIKELQDKLARAAAREAASRRKRDEKLKIMAGACVLEMVKKDASLCRRFRSSLDIFITRPAERVVMNHFDEAVTAHTDNAASEEENSGKAVA